MGRADAVGHRIVHGGTAFTGPVVLDLDVIDELHKLVDLAPLHQPKSLAALEAVNEALPGLPAVGCFDTAFHATLSAAAATYAVPRDWWKRLHVRRYGFHGLSHCYASRRAAQMLRRTNGDGFRVVTCHLGAGASLAAVLNGQSVDTTMGFTPLEGLVMATRSGSVDPGLVLWLLEHARLTPAELSGALEHESGLMAMAGTPDMRDVLRRSDSDAQLAVEVYLHRLRSGIGAMTAALGGLDALVFTGGVGENSAPIRERAASGLEYLGVRINSQMNAMAAPDADLSAEGASARTLVVAAREDIEIARQVRSVLA
ncbi:MAG TPA: acetate/propionate family kinase [Thermoleophilaceae bacterium]|nr:acetate/propionate family kinase [Thermoleophilaceae bacterium]